MIEMTCFECKNAVIDGGFPGNRDEPPSPAFVEDCKHPEVTAEFFEKYIEKEGAEIQLANHCGHFNPIIIDNCENCGLKMNVAKYSWDIVATGYDELPCCSDLCKGQLQLKLDKELKNYG